MVRTFLTSVLAITVLAATARADGIYVGWQTDGAGILGAYDLATGDTIGPPPTFPVSNEKPLGVAVSPLDGNIYVGLDTSSGPSIVSYDPVTGAVVNSNVAGLSSPVFGLCFDSSGNMYAGMSQGSYQNYIAKLSPNGSGGFDINQGWGAPVAGVTAPSYDLTIYNGKLYGSTYNDGVVYDLSGANEGAGAEFVPGYGGLLALAFNTDMGSDGTMYTTHLSSREVRAWYGPNYEYSESEVIGTFSGGYCIQDIDYYDGYLYVKGDRPGGEAGIFRYNLSAASPVWELYIAAKTGYEPLSGGFIDIVSIPEPGMLTLLATGLLGLLAYAWRKRK